MNARSKDAFATAYGLTRPDPNNAGQIITITKAQNRQYRIKEFIKEITKAKEKKMALTAVAGNTRMFVYDVDNATLERVSVGAADSGGAGFKVLRIPN
jgi:hypothetical protein